MKRLQFKGQKVQKKRKERPPKEIVKEEQEENWVLATLDTLSGPCLIGHKSKLVSFVHGRLLVKESEIQLNNVFVIGKFTGTEKIIIKNAFDQFMAPDKYGSVVCELEAAGMAEAWTVLKTDSGFALKSIWNSFLCVDSQNSLSTSHELVDSCIFTFMVHPPPKIVEAKVIVQQSTSSYERDQLDKLYSFGSRLIPYSATDSDLLEKAKRTGQLNKVLLERRSKVKSDRYCK
jgi:protein FRG1